MRSSISAPRNAAIGIVGRECAVGRTIAFCRLPTGRALATLGRKSRPPYRRLDPLKASPQARLPNATYFLACRTPSMECGAGLYPARRLSTGAGGLFTSDSGGLPTRRTQRVPLQTCPTVLAGCQVLGKVCGIGHSCLPRRRLRSYSCAVADAGAIEMRENINRILAWTSPQS